jgi:predicted HTH transcriptional regulator
MIKTKEEILDCLKAGTLLEYRMDNLELKQDWHQEYGKKISALANRPINELMWLCVGVTNEGKIFGHDEKWAKKTEEIISNHINQFLDPQMTCISLSCRNIEQSWIIIIEFKNPGTVVYWNSSAYKSSGTTILEMTQAEVMQLTVSLPGLTDFSAQKTSAVYEHALAVEFAEIVTNHSKSYIDTLAGLTPDEILNRLNLSGTNVCRILFGSYKYRVIYYNERDEPVQNETITGLFNILKPSFADSIQQHSKALQHWRTN